MPQTLLGVTPMAFSILKFESSLNHQVHTARLNIPGKDLGLSEYCLGGPSSTTNINSIPTSQR